MKTLRMFMEDAAVAIANTAGAGHVAGIGVGPQGEPGIPGPVARRKRLEVEDEEIELDEESFAGAEVFDVDADVFHLCRLGKVKYHRWSKYVGDSAIGRRIREFGLKHPKQAILLRNRMSGSMLYLRHPSMPTYSIGKMVV